MKRRHLLAASAATAFAAATRSRAADPVKIAWWHAMTATNGEALNKLVAEFNASQTDVVVEPAYKGVYADVLNATIAAYRAGQAPHIAQIFEVGTGTMLNAGKATKQIWQLSEETGFKIDPATYIPAVRGYYSLPDGRLASVPFNSSTTVMWINKDAFKAAGLDPETPPETWPQVIEAARALKAKNAVEIPVSTGWPCWIHLEQFSAIHNLVYATRADGFEGLDAELKINSPAHVGQIQRLVDMQNEGLFQYAGRGDAVENVFTAGKIGISFESSGDRGLYTRSCKFAFAAAMLPWDPALIKAPNNSIIGGASLWAMTAPDRTAAEYAGVARFLAFLATPEKSAQWHEGTGYVPVTIAGYELAKQQGWYEKNPGTDLPIKQLTRGTVTENSRGFRLGRMAELRNIIEEEMEGALGGKQTAQMAMDNAVARGNKVLRDFERAARG
jgi:sn-glycerol 3-phosphate transport system substrate-binding protein